MAEVLIKAKDPDNYQDVVTIDPEKAEQGCYRKGDIVEVRDDGKIIGPNWEQSLERLPDFVVLIIPNATRSQVQQYMRAWGANVQYEVISHLGDQWQVKVTIVQESTSLAENLRPKARQRIVNWANAHGATIMDHGDNWVVVNFTEREGYSIQDFKDDAFKAWRRVVRQRRYKFNEVDVDEAIAAGGVVTLNRQQAINRLVDKITTPDGF